MRLVTPVLITTAGVLSVKDDAVHAAMTTLSGSLCTIAGHTATLPAILAACQATTAAINKKQFTVNMAANTGGAGSAGAARERSSFSD